MLFWRPHICSSFCKVLLKWLFTWLFYTTSCESWALKRLRSRTALTHIWATEGLGVSTWHSKDNMAADSWACKYWSVHCLAITDDRCTWRQFVKAATHQATARMIMMNTLWTLSYNAPHAGTVRILRERRSAWVRRVGRRSRAAVQRTSSPTVSVRSPEWLATMRPQSWLNSPPQTAGRSCSVSLDGSIYPHTAHTDTMWWKCKKGKCAIPYHEWRWPHYSPERGRKSSPSSLTPQVLSPSLSVPTCPVPDLPHPHHVVHHPHRNPRTFCTVLHIPTYPRASTAVWEDNVCCLHFTKCVFSSNCFW